MFQKSSESSFGLVEKLMRAGPFEDVSGDGSMMPPMAPFEAPFKLAPDTCDGSTDLEVYLVYF